MKNRIQAWMQTFLHSKESRLGLLMGGYVCIFFFLYPIFFTPGRFFTLTDAKYHLFILSVSLLLIFSSFSDFKINLNFKPKNLSVTDWSIIIFLCVSILSAICSEYFFDTINGANGRYHGIITLFSYLVLYFLISRHFQPKHFKAAIFLLAISASLVYLLGIINYANFDPLRFYLNVQEAEKTIFISTIGNRDFFSTFVCLTLPAFMAITLRRKFNENLVGYFIAIFLGFAALCVSNSDGGFIGMIVSLFFLLFYSLRSLEDFKKVIIIFTICSAAIWIVGILTLSMPAVRWASTSMLLSFCTSSYATLLFLFFLVCSFLLCYFTPRLQVRTFPSKHLRLSFGIFFAVCVLVFLAFFFYFSWVNLTYPLGSFSKYLRFSYSWGSNRGIVWKYLLSAFGMLDPIKKLIGTGPDTILQVLHQFFSSNINRNMLLSFDSAHNEYLQYLVTTGILGCVSYTTFAISGIVRQFCSCKDFQFLFVTALVCVCYIVQGFFNISMITSTPFFFIFMALGESMLRNKNKKL